MSNWVRALLIGTLGPAISAVGLVWLLAKSLLLDPQAATFRYLVFDAPHMMIAVGVVVGLAATPIALAVALAPPEDVEFPAFDSESPNGDRANIHPRWFAE